MNSANFTPFSEAQEIVFLLQTWWASMYAFLFSFSFTFVANNVFWEMVIAFSVTEEGVIQASRGKIQGYS